MKQTFPLFLILALLSLTTPSWASVIYVFGDQTGTWSADTVIVTAEVRVPPNMSLTILPGVEVLFSVYCKLIVDSAATLRAVGTAVDSIRFDVLPPDTAWHGIRFLSAFDSSQLEFCILTHGLATGGEEDSKGGAIYCLNSSPTISHNTISGNWAIDGGGIYCVNSSPTINSNTICQNSYSGIWCELSSPSIVGNTISGNLAWNGGGIHCENNSSPIVNDNTICANSADFNGGGIFCLGGSITISGNTISGNSTGHPGFGGGIFCGPGNPTLVNCILWGNSLQQIYVLSGTPQVTYSNIQGGYTGTGNIATYPAFVDTAQNDYRLQWGSPCIDTGDPNPIYNDPDLTRADMGAWYYDQSLPVRILLTPYNAPIQIPAIGGSFQYNIQVTNIGSVTLSTLGWCNVTLPSGTITAPVLGPLNLSLGSGQTLSRVRTQVVPASAPAGLYHYNAYAVAAGDTSTDSFTFVKLGFGIQGSGFDGWANTGEEFDVGARHAVPASGSGPAGGLCSATPTTIISPNPFNPTTAISYELQTASYVSLRVYDTAGRLVVTLVDGWREAGEHKVNFDGRQLPSGMYFFQLTSGSQVQTQKALLLK